MAIDPGVIATTALKWTAWVVIGLGAITVAYIGAIFFNNRFRYKYIIRIFSKDANGQIIQLKDDKAGIFLDKKTQYRLFKLKRNKFALDPDNIPYILTVKGKMLVYLLQTGLKNYQYLTPQIHSNPGLVFNVEDEDVAWAINAWERYKNPYANTVWSQIAPFIGMAFVFITVVVALYFIFTKAGFNADLLRDLADAAIQLKQGGAVSGTTVVQ